MRKKEIEGYLLFLGAQRQSSFSTSVADRQSSSENLNHFEIGSDTSSSPSHKKKPNHQDQ